MKKRDCLAMGFYIFIVGVMSGYALACHHFINYKNIVIP